jgi:hypothetical protein
MPEPPSSAKAAAEAEASLAREQAADLAELERAATSDDEDQMQQIADALQSDHRAVRVRALQLLAARGEEAGAVEEMIAAFSDHDVEVVQTAVDLLVSLPGSGVRETIESQLTPDSAPTLQFAALRALALRGDVASIPAVAAVVHEGPIETRRLADSLLRALQERAEAALTRP